MAKVIKYSNMSDVLSETKKGVAKITKYTIEKGNFAASIEGIPPGEYVKLMVNGQLMMSNTPMEKGTALTFLYAAKGDVLIAGLGIGLVILPLLENDDITSITVVEKYQDVIDCIYPQLKPYDKHNKLSVVCADCFDYTTDKKFDVIYLDIWAYINSDIYNDEMKPLKRKYRQFLKPDKKYDKNIYVWAEFQAKNNLRL